MAASVIQQAFLLASLVFLAGVDAEASVEEFKTLQDDVFGKGFERFSDEFIEEKIHKMIELIKQGDIPAEVQGEQTLEYLNSLTDDCNKDKCNLEEDLERIKRLSGRSTASPNLRSYLQFCRYRVRQRCRSEVYERARAKLSSVSERTMDAIDTFARQVDIDLQPDQFRYYESGPLSDRIDYGVVLRALKKLDPVGSKAMLKKWTRRKAALAKFMDKIRLPCVEFLERIDPIVTISAPNYYHWAEDYWKVNNWHFYLNSCKEIVDNWKSIFENAYASYASYLVDPKSQRTSRFPGCFDGSGVID